MAMGEGLVISKVLKPTLFGPSGGVIGEVGKRYNKTAKINENSPIKRAGEIPPLFLLISNTFSHLHA
jgi:hypothetical protein